MFEEPSTTPSPGPRTPPQAMARTPKPRASGTTARPSEDPVTPSEGPVTPAERTAGASDGAASQGTAPSPASSPRALRLKGLLLAVGLVIVSPVFAEYLAAYDVNTGDPLALVGGLLVLGPLYGCPALLIRETARRLQIGWPGILAMCAAAAIVEAGVFDQSLFSTSYRDIEYWDDILWPTFVEPVGMAAYLTMLFIAGHILWSFGAPIAIVEALGGERARTPWLRWPGLVVTALLYLTAGALILGDHLANERDHASAAQVAGALTVAATLIVAAVTLGRRSAPRRDRPFPWPWVAALATFAAGLGMQLVPPTWPGVGIGVALLAAAAGVLLVASRGARWREVHVVAAAGGPVLALALVGFLSAPLGDVPPVRKYAHNAVLLLATLALIGLAARRAGRADPRRGPEVPRSAAQVDHGSPP